MSGTVFADTATITTAPMTTIVLTGNLKPQLRGWLLAGCSALSTYIAGCSGPPGTTFEERQADDATPKPVRAAAANSSTAKPAPSQTAVVPPASNPQVATASQLERDLAADAAPLTQDAGANEDAATAADAANLNLMDATLTAASPRDAATSDGASPVSASADAQSSLDESAPLEPLPFPEVVCPPTFLPDVVYAEGNDFWLGQQSETKLSLSGLGYFASEGTASGHASYRYGRSLGLSVAPDGTLEDPVGYAVLGTSADEWAGDCLSTLRAPIAIPHRATTVIELHVNLDASSPLPDEYFDPAKPANTAIAPPFSVSAVDVDGRTHPLSVYFENTGMGGFRYHVYAAAADMDPTAVGLVELDFGDLQFDAEGALVTESSPTLCPYFAGASSYACFTFDLGPALADADGATGFEGSTSLETPTALLYEQADGYRAGTGETLQVDPSGLVSVVFDNDQKRAIGTLTLARFPNEAALTPIDGTAVGQSAESGMPAFGPPGSPGRGLVAD